MGDETEAGCASASISVRSVAPLEGVRHPLPEEPNHRDPNEQLNDQRRGNAEPAGETVMGGNKPSDCQVHEGDYGRQQWKIPKCAGNAPAVGNPCSIETQLNHPGQGVEPVPHDGCHDQEPERANAN